jgi:chromosome partitioning protein
MRVIVFASRKGGAGKTTLASALAVEAGRVGAGPVGIVDCDPMQGLAQWWDARRHSEHPVLASFERGLPAALAAMDRQGVKVVMVDTPSAIDASVAGIVGLADLVVIPVRASPDDLRAIGSTVDLVQRSGKPLVFVVNAVRPGVKLPMEVVVALSQHGTVAPVQVADRTAYAAAKVNGHTAPELNASGRAASEIETLWTYIAKRIDPAR